MQKNEISRRDFVRKSALLTGGAMAFQGLSNTQAAAKTISSSISNGKPNVVVMMVDNLGWGEIGCYGGGILRGAETPSLDRLAEDGLKLLNFNVEPVWS